MTIDKSYFSTGVFHVLIITLKHFLSINICKKVRKISENTENWIFNIWQYKHLLIQKALKYDLTSLQLQLKTGIQSNTTFHHELNQSGTFFKITLTTLC